MTSENRKIVVLSDAREVARAACDEFVRCAKHALGEQERFTVALAGGSTPKSLYVLLAENGGSAVGGPTVWERIVLFWGDERHVPPDHPDSNYRMAREALLSKVPIPAENVHRIMGEDSDAGRAAEAYERTLQEAFRLSPGQLPRFDLVLLGMGPDGHTASLFPGSVAIDESRRLVAAPWVEKFSSHRITLTPPVLNSAVRILFMVTGAEKAETLREVLEGKRQPERFPSQVIVPVHGELLWLVDRAAASRLQRAG